MGQGGLVRGQRVAGSWLIEKGRFQAAGWGWAWLFPCVTDTGREFRVGHHHHSLRFEVSAWISSVSRYDRTLTSDNYMLQG